MKVFLSIIGIAVTIYMLILAYHLYRYLSVFGEVRESIENESYQGVIIDIDTTSNTSEIYVSEGNETKIMKIHALCNDSFLRYINLNDYLEKKKDEMTITIERTNTPAKNFSFDPCIM